MKKPIVAVIVAAACAVAFAQTPAPPQEMTPAEAANARQKASRGNIKSATSGTAKGYTGAAARRRDQSRQEQGHAERHARRKAEAGRSEVGDGGHRQGLHGRRRRCRGQGRRRQDAAAAQASRHKAGTPELNKVVP